MKLATFLPALAVLGLSGCVTGYGYSDDGYYYGRPAASVGAYGSYGYGPGYYGYYDPYRGYYYDPYYGYYFPRPPVVIIQRPPGDGHGHGGHDHDHDGDDHDHDGHEPPPWRDLDNLGNNGPRPVRAPDASDGGARPRPLAQPQAGDVPSPPARVRMSDPTPPRVNRVDSPRPATVAPSMPRMGDDDAPMRKGDRRR
ncbi:hypothetical protein [Pseudoluteimonas lycopersici]|uniref:hypothetical protein n=1 Tax=Pseudoluteimonas lycopersici TaxID=1324796 RepID=UPI00163D4184|nr:hypothetical protein [Lysobacter lycopersici]